MKLKNEFPSQAQCMSINLFSSQTDSKAIEIRTILKQRKDDQSQSDQSQQSQSGPKVFSFTYQGRSINLKFDSTVTRAMAGIADVCFIELDAEEKKDEEQIMSVAKANAALIICIIGSNLACARFKGKLLKATKKVYKYVVELGYYLGRDIDS